MPKIAWSKAPPDEVAEKIKDGLYRTPFCSVTAEALADKLAEQGWSPHRVKSYVSHHKRLARMFYADDLLSHTNPNGREARRVLRRAVRWPEIRPGFLVHEGGDAPRLSFRPAWSGREHSNGPVVRHPARRYIRVGADWILRKIGLYQFNRPK